jgi:hypothetical protein
MEPFEQKVAGKYNNRAGHLQILMPKGSGKAYPPYCYDGYPQKNKQAPAL